MMQFISEQSVYKFISIYATLSAACVKYVAVASASKIEVYLQKYFLCKN